MRSSAVRNPKWWSRQLEAHKLACIAFAHQYGKQREWDEKHSKVSPWSPRVDFTIGDQTVRIIAVPCDEETTLGYKTVGKVWENDYTKGHDVYILAAVYLPYVDFIGWIGRDSLQDYKRQHSKSASYDLQETATRPMYELIK